ncbi:MAG: hypothetical protein ACTII7_04300 [Galactobacter sp.]
MTIKVLAELGERRDRIEAARAAMRHTPRDSWDDYVRESEEWDRMSADGFNRDA